MNGTHLKSVAAVAALGIGIAGTLAVRAFFDRPGESALRLMSADADMVFIQDLVPAPNQVLAFERIQHSFSQNGIKADTFNLISSELNEDQISKSIGKYFGRSMAAELRFKGPAALPANLPKFDGVAFVSLTDPGAAKVALENSLTSSGGGIYKLESGRFARIADGYLQVASSTAWFSKVDAVASGRAKSIASTERFQKAEGLADRGANFKLYLRNQPKSDWGVLSGAIEDGGIRLDLRGPASWMPQKSKTGSSANVSGGTLKMLPSGAYLLMAIGQPLSLTHNHKSFGKDSEKMANALSGDFALGLYPSQKPWAGIDLLLAANSNHGAKPREAFKDIVKGLQSGFNQGKPIFGAPVSYGRAKLYGPSAELKKQISAMTQAAESNKVVRGDVLLKNKTLAYATVGEKLYIGTSMAILRRAVSAATGAGPSIGGDPEFLPFAKGASEGGQFLLGIDVQRIVAGILNTAAPGNKDAVDIANSLRVATNGIHIVNIYGGTNAAGLVHGHLFVPVDYGRLAKMISQNRN